MNLYELIICTNNILFESFKSDLIDTYNKNGVQVDGNQKLLAAVQIFNGNSLIKDKVKKDLKNPPNIAIALVNSFPDPQDLIEYINRTQQGFVEREQQNKERKQRKETAERASGSFFVYPCHTFEEAHSAAFSHSGSLERLSNKDIKEKYKIEVPEPASHYSATKSPAEMLEFMKSVPFFMNPSWCITAGQRWWNSYKLSTAKDEIPKCYIIISKAYPNIRFCIVLEDNDTHIDKMTDESITISKKLEIRELRDPWQIGCHNCIEIGKDMLDLAFNKSKAIEDVITKATKKVAYVKSFKDITDNRNNISFEKIESLTQFNTELPNLKDGQGLFSQCKNLTSFKGGLPKLENGCNMFKGCEKLVSFNIDLPSLKDGAMMFFECKNLTSFKGGLPKLEFGNGMFCDCEKLVSFNIDLPSLENGHNMFYGCWRFTSFDVDMPNLKDGRWMFAYCRNLASFDVDIHNLENGQGMFKGCRLLTSFCGDLSSLKGGDYMFDGCHSFTSFRGDLSSLVDGDKMFFDCTNLTSFHSNLSSLKYGEDMFKGCKLDKESVINIANTLPTLQNRRRIDIGIDASLKRNKDITKAIRTIKEKNWITKVIYS